MKKHIAAVVPLLFWAAQSLFAQTPAFTYGSPQTFITNKVITPVGPANTGGPAGLPGTYNNPITLVNIPTGQGANFVTVDANNNVFYSVGGGSNSVFEIPAGGGSPIDYTGANSGNPTGIAVDAAGDLFVAYSHTNILVEYFVNHAGTAVLATGFNDPQGIALDIVGNIYVADSGNKVIKIVPAGGGTPISIGTGLTAPEGVAVDASGNIYVSDFELDHITEFPTGAGSPISLGSGLHFSWGLTIDASGSYLYVADKGNSSIKKIPTAGGAPITIGPSSLQTPEDVALDAAGNLYITDSGHGTAEAFKEMQQFKGYTISPALPAGLNFDNTTGIISGTPSAPMDASNFTVSASNTSGTGSASLVIQIKSVPTVTYSSPQSYNVGAPITPLVPTSTDVASPGYSQVVSVGTGFSSPTGVATDVNGNVFVTDASHNVIKKIPFDGGPTVTVSSGYKNPHGIAVDGNGSLYIADYGNNAVIEVQQVGASYVYSTNVGTGFINPAGVAVDAAGNVYVADYGNNAVKKVPPGGGLTVTIGSGFSHPSGVAVDRSGNVYVADLGNKAVKMIPAAGGAVVTLGTGFISPYGICVDPAGEILVADAGSNYLMMVPPGGGAATGYTGSSFSGVLSGPTGVVVDGTGNIFVADQLHNAVKEVSPVGGYFINTLLPPGLSLDNGTGIITGTPVTPTPAKNYTLTGYNAYGSAQATLNINTFSPAPAISYNTPVNYLVNVAITPLAPANTGSAVTAPGYSTSTTALGLGFSYPADVAVDALGNVYVADNLHARVKEIPAAGGAIAVLGSGFSSPAGVAVDATGNVYVADQSRTTIKKISAGNGAVVDIGSGFSSPSGVAVDALGNVYVSDSGNNMVKEIPAGGGATIVLAAGFNQPVGIAVDALRNVYVADAGNNAIKKIPVNGGAVVTLASGFSSPYGVTIDGGGNLYISDTNNNAVKVIFSGQATPVVLGSGFFGPSGLAVDGIGNVYVADQGNSAVKKISPAGGFYISQQLPAGLHFNGKTGVITGTPAVVSAITNYKITGYNASSGSTATANIYVNYNLGLSSLVVSAGTVSPAFTSDIVNYTDNITGPVTSVTFTPTLIDPEAVVTVNGVAVPSGTASAPIPFSGTSNIISVVVSASGTLATRVYTYKLIVPAPTISYQGPVNYISGSAITPLAPTSTNVAADGYLAGRSIVTSAVTTPTCVVVDASGNVFIGTPTGTSLTEIPVGGGTPIAYGSGLSSERGLAIDRLGNIYVADAAALAVKKIPAGGGIPVSIGTGFSGPFGMAVDDAGNVYVADRGSNSLKKILVADGSTVTLTAGFNNPSGVAVDSQGNIYVSDSGNNAVKEIPVGGGAMVSIGSGHGNPFGLAIDPAGNLFIAEASIGRVKEVFANGTQAFIATGFILNTGVAVDQYGLVYMTDSGDNFVYAAKPSGGYHLSADLPAGLYFSSATGVISGTPTASSPATNYTVSVYNSGGSGKATVNIGVTSTQSVATLSNVAISAGNLNPVFAAGTTSYTANVGNVTNSITITPTATNPAATIKVNGNTVATGTVSAAIPLNVGANTVTTIVTAPDGVSTKTYTVTVTRAASANAKLLSLATNAGVLSPAFNNTVTSYTRAVANTVTSITITPTAVDPTAIITVNGATVASGAASTAINLIAGPNVINTQVTAQDGVTKITYTITVTRAASADATLSNLAISAGTIKPTFDAATTAYTDAVGSGVASVTVTPTTTDAGATVMVNGVAVTSGSPSGAIALVVGANVITTVITAQNGITTKNYKITVTRAASTNAKLLSLSTSSGVLSPAFNNTVTSYTRAVPGNVASITFTPTVVDATATITINGTAAASGVASAAQALVVGNNTEVIKVTAQDGVTSITYTVIVTRAAGPIANPYEPLSVAEAPASPILNDDGINVHPGLSPNGDGINDYLIIESIAAHPDNKLQIMTRSGQLVFEARGYDNTTKVFDGHSNKNGKMQLPGTYFYSLDYTVNGVARHKTGFIVLKY